MFTTNEEDLREAARLQKRLQDTAADDDDNNDDDGCIVTNNDSGYRIPNVSIDSGANKYVLISAILPGRGERQHFVVSRRGAEYHRNAAEPFVEALERSGYSSINILGGGRISLNEPSKTIKIFGYSYGFGLADHALSKAVVENDHRYKDFDITWSNEGY